MRETPLEALNSLSNLKYYSYEQFLFAPIVILEDIGKALSGVSLL